MMRANISMTFEVDGDGNLDVQTDLVFEALLALEQANVNLCDSDLDAILTDRLVTLRVAAQADTLDQALALGGSAIRAAIHTAGGATPGWTNPTPDDATPTSSTFELRDQQMVPVHA